MPSLRRAVKVMKGWSYSWGREQYWTLGFRSLLGGIMSVTVFFSQMLDKSITWSFMKDVNRTWSLRLGDTTGIICSKVYKFLSDLKRHISAQKSSPRTKSRNIYSHHCLSTLLQVLQNCCCSSWSEKWFEGWHSWRESDNPDTAGGSRDGNILWRWSNHHHINI